MADDDDDEEILTYRCATSSETVPADKATRTFKGRSPASFCCPLCGAVVSAATRAAEHVLVCGQTSCGWTSAAAGLRAPTAGNLLLALVQRENDAPHDAQIRARLAQLRQRLSQLRHEEGARHDGSLRERSQAARRLGDAAAGAAAPSSSAWAWAYGVSEPGAVWAALAALESVDGAATLAQRLASPAEQPALSSELYPHRRPLSTTNRLRRVGDGAAASDVVRGPASPL